MCWMDFLTIMLFIFNLTALCAVVEVVLDVWLSWRLGKLACLVMLVAGYMCAQAWQDSGFSFCQDVTQPEVMQCEPTGNTGTQQGKVVL